MNSINEDNLHDTQDVISNEDNQQVVRRAHPISPSKKQEGILKSGIRVGGAVPSRRNKISPKRKEEYIQGVNSQDFDPQEHAENSQDLESDLKTILESRRKIGGFAKELPDVLKQEEKREKKRFTAMLEPKTVDFLQELKATRKIRSVSGLLETALEEFFQKYNLK